MGSRLGLHCAVSHLVMSEARCDLQLSSRGISFIGYSSSRGELLLGRATIRCGGGGPREFESMRSKEDVGSAVGVGSDGASGAVLHPGHASTAEVCMVRLPPAGSRGGAPPGWVDHVTDHVADLLLNHFAVNTSGNAPVEVEALLVPSLLTTGGGVEMDVDSAVDLTCDSGAFVTGQMVALENEGFASRIDWPNRIRCPPADTACRPSSGQLHAATDGQPHCSIAAALAAASIYDPPSGAASPNSGARVVHGAIPASTPAISGQAWTLRGPTHELSYRSPELCIHPSAHTLSVLPWCIRRVTASAAM